MRIISARPATRRERPYHEHSTGPTDDDLPAEIDFSTLVNAMLRKDIDLIEKAQ